MMLSTSTLIIILISEHMVLEGSWIEYMILWHITGLRPYSVKQKTYWTILYSDFILFIPNTWVIFNTSLDN